MIIAEDRAGAERPSTRPPDEARSGGDGVRRDDRRPEATAAEPRRHARHPGRVAATIAAVGLLLNATASWAAGRIDSNTEQSLLEGQTRQAAAVLSTAIMVVEQQLDSALAVQQAAAKPARGRAFAQYMTPRVGQGKTFQSASLWVRRGGRLERLAAVGTAPVMRAGSPDTLTQLRRAFDSKTTMIRFVTANGRTRVVYLRADPADGSLLYTESTIPENRRAPVDKDSAFKQLHYAIYLGRSLDTAALSTTDVDPGRLPFHGVTDSETVPFGDNVVTLSTMPRVHLGSDLSRQLPWLLLLAGLLLTAIATRTGQQLARGRQTAEQDAATITALYQHTDSLYGQQRELFVSLQRALLPHMNPEIPNLELAAEYAAGARGLDIGGDWYSIIGLGESRFGFVVGDVSGRGIDAVAVMAQARFTIRSYLVDGDDPATVLDKCAPQFDILRDDHLTTALVGVGDWRTGEITLASAGHPPPVLLTDAGATLVEVSPGRPLGTGIAPYPSATITMPRGATLFCYTDGLVERRGEDIDVGLDRLAAVLSAAPEGSVEELVEHALDTLRHDDAADDIATLAIRWTGEL